MTGERMNHMQLLANRGKVFYADLPGFDQRWREHWNARTSRLLIGKRRVYDHVDVGNVLTDVCWWVCEHEYRNAHLAYGSRGWRSFGSGRRWNGRYVSFHWRFPPF